MTCRPMSATVISVALLMPLIACEAKKSENPLSPSVAGPIAGVEITAPRQLQPAQGTKLKESQQPLALVVENSSTNGVRPIAYSFEIAADSGFETKMYARSGVSPGADGRTTVTVDRLESGRGYYWRVRAEDGANSSAYSTAAFEILPKPQLDPPSQHSPVNNDQTSSRRPELIVGQSKRNAAIGNVAYEFHLAIDPSFGGMAAAGTRSEAGATTSFVPDGDLAAATTYFWRVRATDDEFTSNWSSTQSFRTPAAPAPGPGPGPGPAPGAACNFNDGEAIVACERSKHGFMNDDELVQFMRDVADSLNRNNIPGGRFGLLQKTSGSNCGGYSCDIICSGNGGSQRQWDVLVDVGGSQGASWSEVSNITVRVCEIR
jgi:hypothetical protein